MSATQEAIDAGNARFWDELCGSALARQLRIEDASADSLRRFDDAYLDLYPYLEQYLDARAVAGRSVLEVGLGYGTRERPARGAWSASCTASISPRRRWRWSVTGCA